MSKMVRHFARFLTTLPENQVIKALEYFVECRQRAPFIQWHDDSAQLGSWHF
jgi:hypothetical protein